MSATVSLNLQIPRSRAQGILKSSRTGAPAESPADPDRKDRQFHRLPEGWSIYQILFQYFTRPLFTITTNMFPHWTEKKSS